MSTLISHIVTYLPLLLAGFLVCLLMLIIQVTRKRLKHEGKKENLPQPDDPLLPSISIIIPTRNNRLEVINTITMLLQLEYRQFELIVVNDESTDDTLELVKRAFEMQVADIVLPQYISTFEIKGVYRSKNTFFNKITLIDKKRGGKADTINVGVNAALYNFCCIVEPEWELESDVLLKLAKAYLDNPSSKKLLAITSIKSFSPKKSISDWKSSLLIRSQQLSFMRSFTWRNAPSIFKKTNLFNYPGLFVLYNKMELLKVGAWDFNTSGLASNVLIKLYQKVMTNREKYDIKHLHRPLCNVPLEGQLQTFLEQESDKYYHQIKTIWNYRKMFFNSKLGWMGFVRYPMWFLYKIALPIIAIVFIIYMFLSLLNVKVTFKEIIEVFAALYLIIAFFSSGAVMFEELTLQKYQKTGSSVFLLLNALIEPFYRLPIQLWIQIKGLWKLVIGHKEEEEEALEFKPIINDDGLSSNSIPIDPNAIPITSSGEVSEKWWKRIIHSINDYIELDTKNTVTNSGEVSTAAINSGTNSTTVGSINYYFISERFREGLQRFVGLNIVFLIVLLFVRFYEYCYFLFTESLPESSFKYEWIGATYDLLLLGKIAACMFIPFIIIYLYKPKVANAFYKGFITLTCVFYFFLVDYFSKQLLPLGTVWINYAFNDYIQFLQETTTFLLPTYLAYILVSIIIFAGVQYLSKQKYPKLLQFPFYCLLIIALLFSGTLAPKVEQFDKEIDYYLANNKLELFIKQYTE